MKKIFGIKKKKKRHLWKQGNNKRHSGFWLTAPLPSVACDISWLLEAISTSLPNSFPPPQAFQLLHVVVWWYACSTSLTDNVHSRYAADMWWTNKRANYNYWSICHTLHIPQFQFLLQHGAKVNQQQLMLIKALRKLLHDRNAFFSFKPKVIINRINCFFPCVILVHGGVLSDIWTCNWCAIFFVFTVVWMLVPVTEHVQTRNQQNILYRSSSFHNGPKKKH